MLDGFFILPFAIDFQVGAILLFIAELLLLAVTVKLIFSCSLLETVIVMSAFSVLISLCYLLMNAPDVAMTEVALGSCLSTCVLLNFLRSLDTETQAPSKQEFQKKSRRNIIVATILCISFIIILTWIGLQLPEYGNANSPLQTHVSKYYIENTKNDTGLPSMVAVILASYRGYDTLGETSVILIAGLAMLLILSKKDKKDA